MYKSSIDQAPLETKIFVSYGMLGVRESLGLCRRILYPVVYTIFPGPLWKMNGRAITKNVNCYAKYFLAYLDEGLRECKTSSRPQD